MLGEGTAMAGNRIAAGLIIGGKKGSGTWAQGRRLGEQILVSGGLKST